MRREGYKLPVALKDIYVIDLETFKAFLDRVEDVLTNEGVRWSMANFRKALPCEKGHGG